ncbi:hypothetical protein [Streptomyces sp. NPDC002156]
MRNPRTYVYRLLKTSWGVRVSITAQAEIREGAEGGRVDPSVPVWIAFGEVVAELPETFREKMREGLSVVADEISGSVLGRPVTVTVSELSYVESDFQIEGISVAMCRWAEEEFVLPRRRIEESFDPATNRYVFDWR